MKLHFSKELRAGVIVLLIALAMYWLVYFLSGRNIFNHFSSYFIEYENVEGVTITGPVYIRGLKVGTIKSISYNMSKDLFEVVVQLESKYLIPDNSVAQIYSVDLLGTKAIRIGMGNSITNLSNNDRMQSDIETDLMSYLGRELPGLKEQIEGFLSGLENTLQNVNKILGAQNQENIENTLSKLPETIQHFHKLGALLNKELPQLSYDLSDNLTELKKAITNLVQFTDALTEIEIAKTVHDLNLLIVELQNPNSSVGKLLNSDEVHQSLTTLIQNLDSLVNNISRNPKKYLKISVF